MNARTQAPAVPEGGGLARTTSTAPFFDFQARYSIDAGATLPEMVKDGHSLLLSALAVLDLIEPDSNELFAVLHLLRQAESCIGVASGMSEFLEPADKLGGAA